MDRFNNLYNGHISKFGYSSQAVLADDITDLKEYVEDVVPFTVPASSQTYKGTWDANTNTPTILSSTGTLGDYYIVSVAGAASINGVSTWGVGDQIIFNGSIWERVDNAPNVFSVNGASGVVSLASTDLTDLAVASTAVSTDNAVPRYNLATGRSIQDSGVLIDDTNNMTGLTSIAATTIQSANHYNESGDAGIFVGTGPGAEIFLNSTNYFGTDAMLSLRASKALQPSTATLNASGDMSVNSVTSVQESLAKGKVSNNLLLSPDDDAGPVATGENNVILGRQAGTSLTTGQRAVAIGFGVKAGTTANNAISIGRNAGSSTSTGNNNISIGLNAGDLLTTGVDNIQIGKNVAGSSAAGSCNIAIGDDARVGPSANFNVSVGRRAGNSAMSGTENISLGLDTNNALTTGVANVALGASSNPLLTTGSNNVAIGKAAGCAATVDNSLALGAGATVTSSNECVLGDGSLTHVRANVTNICDLGTSGVKFKDGYFEGVMNVGSIVTGVGDLTVKSTGVTTDNAIPKYDLTTGKLIQNSGVIIDDVNNITGATSLAATTIKSANHYNDTGDAGVFVGTGPAGEIFLNSTSYTGTDAMLSLKASKALQPSTATLSATGDMTVTSSRTNSRNNATGTAGITLTDTPVGDVNFTGSAYNVAQNGKYLQLSGGQLVPATVSASSSSSATITTLKFQQDNNPVVTVSDGYATKIGSVVTYFVSEFDIITSANNAEIVSNFITLLEMTPQGTTLKMSKLIEVGDDVGRLFIQYIGSMWHFRIRKVDGSVWSAGSKSIEPFYFSYRASNTTDLAGTMIISSTEPYTPPTVISLNPTVGATGVAINSNLGITFNENIAKGTGDIRIKRYSDDALIQTVDVTSVGVTVSTNMLTIDPPADLANGIEYYLEIDNTAVEDLSSNAWLGISSKDTWKFTTVVLVPNVLTYNPALGTSNINNSCNLLITYDKQVTIETGNVYIKRYSDDALIQTISVTTGSLSTTTFTNDTLTVNPPNDLTNSTQYYIETDAGIVNDLSSNGSLAISGKTTWNFTTGSYPTAPGFVERCTRFGFHKVNGNYTGPCITVSEFSNGTGANQDIYWQSDGFVDKTAIEAFRTTYTNVFLKTIHDQNASEAITSAVGLIQFSTCPPIPASANIPTPTFSGTLNGTITDWNNSAFLRAKMCIIAFKCDSGLTNQNVFSGTVAGEFDIAIDGTGKLRASLRDNDAPGGDYVSTTNVNDNAKHIVVIWQNNAGGGCYLDNVSISFTGNTSPTGVANEPLLITPFGGKLYMALQHTRDATFEYSGYNVTDAGNWYTYVNGLLSSFD